MVETMHDGLRLAMANLRTDVQDGMQPFTILLIQAFGWRSSVFCQCCCSWYIPHKSCWQLQQQICTVPGEGDTDLLHASPHKNLLDVCLSLTLTSVQGFANKIEQLQAANVAAHEKLTKGMVVSELHDSSCIPVHRKQCMHMPIDAKTDSYPCRSLTLQIKAMLYVCS